MALLKNDGKSGDLLKKATSVNMYFSIGVRFKKFVSNKDMGTTSQFYVLWIASEEMTSTSENQLYGSRKHHDGATSLYYKDLDFIVHYKLRFGACVSSLHPRPFKKKLEKCNFEIWRNKFRYPKLFSHKIINHKSFQLYTFNIIMFIFYLKWFTEVILISIVPIN